MVASKLCHPQTEVIRVESRLLGPMLLDSPQLQPDPLHADRGSKGPELGLCRLDTVVPTLVVSIIDSLAHTRASGWINDLDDRPGDSAMVRFCFGAPVGCRSVGRALCKADAYGN